MVYGVLDYGYCLLFVTSFYGPIIEVYLQHASSDGHSTQKSHPNTTQVTQPKVALLAATYPAFMPRQRRHQARLQQQQPPKLLCANASVEQPQRMTECQDALLIQHSC